MRCAVQNCNNDNDSKASTISFFAFPTDPILQEQWISFCCRKEKFKLKTSVICMEHFQPEDFANKLQYDMGFTKRRLLNQGAVPSVKKLPPKREKLFQERQQRIEKQKNKNTVRMLIEEHEAASAVVEETPNPVHEQTDSSNEVALLKNDIEFLHLEIAELNKSNRKLETKLGALSKRMEEESKIHEVNIGTLKTELMKAKYELNSLESNLSTIFTKGQISKLKTNNKRRLWTKEDLVQSLSLYKTSPQLYKLMYSKNFPLPAVSTLLKWKLKKVQVGNQTEQKLEHYYSV